MSMTNWVKKATFVEREASYKTGIVWEATSKLRQIIVKGVQKEFGFIFKITHHTRAQQLQQLWVAEVQQGSKKIILEEWRNVGQPIDIGGIFDPIYDPIA